MVSFHKKKGPNQQVLSCTMFNQNYYCLDKRKKKERNPPFSTAFLAFCQNSLAINFQDQCSSCTQRLDFYHSIESQCKQKKKARIHQKSQSRDAILSSYLQYKHKLQLVVSWKFSSVSPFSLFLLKVETVGGWRGWNFLYKVVKELDEIII